MFIYHAEYGCPGKLPAHENKKGLACFFVIDQGPGVEK